MKIMHYHPIHLCWIISLTDTVVPQHQVVLKHLPLPLPQKMLLVKDVIIAITIRFFSTHQILTFVKQLNIQFF